MTNTITQAGRREWIGLAVLMLPTLLIAMDMTVLHLAVPHLTAELQPSSVQLLWITDIYGFMIAGALITMGTLGDRIGRRKLLMIGAAAFGVASVVAAFAPSANLLIASRALLGIAGATLMPSTMSLIRNMFHDPRQRTVAIGIWVSGFSAGSAIGPLLGGLLLEYFWWGSVFLLGVPVMAILLIAAPLLLPEYKDPVASRFDFLSAGLSLVSVLTVIYGLKQIAQEGIGLLPALSIVVGLVVGVVFVRRQQTLADPLLDLRLFRSRAFSTSLITYTFGVFAGFGTFLFIAQYLQLVLGLSPLEAGMWSVPGAVAFIIGSNLSPRVVRHVRPAYLISAGLALSAVGFWLVARIGLDSLANIVIGNALMSLGFGFTFTLTADMVVSTAPPERAGAASALSETGAEFGGALGIAVLGSIGMAIYRSQVSAELPTGISPEIAKAVQETLGSAVAAIGQIPEQAALLTSAQEAFVNGLQIIATVGTVGFAVLAVVIALMLRHIEPHSGDESEAELKSEAPVQKAIPRPQPEIQAGD